MPLPDEAMGHKSKPRTQDYVQPAIAAYLESVPKETVSLWNLVDRDGLHTFVYSPLQGKHSLFVTICWGPRRQHAQ